MSDVKTTISIEASDKATEQLKRLREEAAELAKEMVEGNRKIASSSGTVLAELAAQEASFKRLREAITGVTRSYTSLAKKVEKIHTSDGLAKMATYIDKVAQGADRSATSIGKITESAEKSSAKIRENSANVTELTAAVRQLQQAYAQAAASSKQIANVKIPATPKAPTPRPTTPNTPAAEPAGSSFSMAALGIGGTIGIGALALEFIKAGDAVTNLQGRLKIATAGFADYTSVQRSLFDISQANSIALEDAGRLYTRLAMNAKELGVSNSDLLRTVDLVGKAIQISGASTSEASAATLQFSQALAAGKLNGDELRSVLENSPRLAKALADGLGVAVGQLKKLGEEGALSSKLVLQALLAQGPVLEAEFAKVPMTVGRAVQQAQNSLLVYAGGLNETINANAALAGAIKLASDNMSTFVGAGATLVAMLATAAAGSRAGTSAMAAFGGSLLNMLNPAALAAAGITAIGTAMINVAADAERASVRAQAALGSIGDKIVEVNKLIKEAEAGSKTAAASSVLKANQAVKEAEAELSAAQKANAKAATGTGFAGLVSYLSGVDNSSAVAALQKQVENAKQQQALANEAAGKLGVTAQNAGAKLTEETARTLTQNDYDTLVKKYRDTETKRADAIVEFNEKAKRLYGENYADNAKYQKDLAALNKSFDKKGSKGKTPDLSQENFAIAKANAEAEYNQKLQEQSALQDKLASQLEYGQISVADYYKKVIESEQAVIAAKEKALGLERQQAAANQADAIRRKDKDNELRATAQIAKIDGDIAVLRLRNTEIQTRADRERVKAIQAIKDALNSLGLDEAKATRSVTPEQIRAAADEKFRQLRYQAGQSGDPEQMKKVLAAQERFTISLKLDIDRQSIEDIKNRLETERAAIEAKVSLQALGRGEADAQIAAASKRAQDAIQVMLPAMSEAAKKVGEDAVNAVDKIKGSMSDLQKEVEKTSLAMNEAFKTGLADGFKDAVMNGGSLKDVAKAGLNSAKAFAVDKLATGASEEVLGVLKNIGLDPGGIFSKALGVGQTKDGAPIDTAKNALRVTVVDKAAGVAGAASDVASDPLGSLVSYIQSPADAKKAGGTEDPVSKTTEVFDTITQKVTEFGSEVFTQFGDIFGSLSSGIGSLLNSLMGAMTSSGGGGGGAGLVGAFAGAFGFATGGHVRGPGTSTSDSIPAWLSDDEYVVNAAAHRRVGTAALDAINYGITGKSSSSFSATRDAFAEGGAVSAGEPRRSARSNHGGSNVTVNLNVNAKDANSFNKSRSQQQSKLAIDSQRALQRAR